MTIWKYSLTTDNVQEIEVPICTRLLSVQTQDGIPCMWALVDSSQPRHLRKIYTFGTGQELNWLPETLTYIGTYQLFGNTVLHVFMD